MKAVIQRCRHASVQVEGETVGEIGQGLVIFLGVAAADDETCAARLTKKIAALRIFDDSDGKFNFSLQDVAGAALVVSNFTLYGDARKGTRPNFSAAAGAELANRLYESFAKLLIEQGISVQKGVFGAAMQVQVFHDGPVTLILEATADLPS